MRNILAEYESQAYQARSESNFDRAIDLYEKIIQENPGWEHGEAYLNLASCYEANGNIEKAEENYLNALRIQPDYYIFVGGYASFLDKYGEPRMAFDWYLKLFNIEKEMTGSDSVQSLAGRIEHRLFELGAALGMRDDEIVELIDSP